MENEAMLKTACPNCGVLIEIHVLKTNVDKAEYLTGEAVLLVLNQDERRDLYKFGDGSGWGITYQGGRVQNSIAKKLISGDKLMPKYPPTQRGGKEKTLDCYVLRTKKNEERFAGYD